MTDQDKLARRIRLLQEVGWHKVLDKLITPNERPRRWWLISPIEFERHVPLYYLPAREQDTEPELNLEKSDMPDPDADTAEGDRIRAQIRLHLFKRGCWINYEGYSAQETEQDFQVVFDHWDFKAGVMCGRSDSWIEAFLCAADAALTALALTAAVENTQEVGQEEGEEVTT